MTYFETWKCIAAAIGRSERWCRMMGQRPEDPLPVWKFCGTIRIEKSDLDVWIARQRKPMLLRPVAEAVEGLRLIA